MTTQTVSVLYRPTPFAETARPLQQLPVAGHRCLNLQRRDLTVSGRVDDTGHMQPLMRIYPDNDHAEPLSPHPRIRNRGRHADLKLISPLLSQSTSVAPASSTEPTSSQPEGGRRLQSAIRAERALASEAMKSDRAFYRPETC